jgi:sulfofructose kinase
VKSGVVCVGIAVQDMVFGLSELPVSEGKYRATEFASVGGGMAASAAAAIAQLGTSAQLWTRLGDDSIADSITVELRELGVDTTWCSRSPGAKSSLSAVMVDAQGERLVVNYTDPSIDPSPDWLPLAHIETSACVLVDTRWEQGAVAALDAAKRANIPAVLDADSAPVPASILERATHCVFSRRALAACSKSDDIERGLRIVGGMTDGIVAVTRGAEGADWIQQGVLHHQPAFTVPVVDTLGAGDVFHGALAVALGEGTNFPHAVRFASAAAALKCTRFGGRRGTPARHEVQTLLNKRN